MWPNPQETADLVTFTEEILNGKHFLCSVRFNFSTKFPKISFHCLIVFLDPAKQLWQSIFV